MFYRLHRQIVYGDMYRDVLVLYGWDSLKHECHHYSMFSNANAALQVSVSMKYTCTLLKGKSDRSGH